MVNTQLRLRRTVIPSTPANQPVTISSADVSAINFTAVAPSNSITLDVNASQNGAKAGTTIASPTLSTATTNELLLAFVATDYISGTNTTVKSISGGGLTWTLVERTNAQSGSAEIWRAFAASALSNVTVTATLSQSVISSMTVMSFSGVKALQARMDQGRSGQSAARVLSLARRRPLFVTTLNNSLGSPESEMTMTAPLREQWGRDRAWSIST